MSLINDVLRKMDQGRGGARTGSVPSNMTPPADPPGRSPGRFVAFVAMGGLLFLVGLGAGLGGWWFLKPPSGAGGGDIVPVEPTTAQRSQSPARPEPESGRTAGGEGAGDSQAAGGAGEATEKDSGSRPSSQEEPGAEPEPSNGDTDLPPFSPEMAEAAIAPPGKSGPSTTPGPASPGKGDSNAESEGGGAKGQDSTRPGPSGRIEVKGPSRSPVKVVVRRPPEGDPSPSTGTGSGSGVTRQGTGETVAADTPDGAPGDMRVRTPQSWEDSRRAGDLARRGFRALGAQRYQRAAGLLERAQRLAPGRTDIINNLGLAQWQSGSRREAIRTLAAGLRAHPDNDRMARNLAHFLLREKSPGREAGVRALEEALKAQQSLPLYALVGSVYRDMGRFGEAISLYQTGIARNGPNWRLLLGLGMALEAEGRHEKAVQVYERAGEELPADLEKVRRSLERRISSLESVSG